MPIQVKICGITTPEAAEATVRAGADFAGLVFHARSPRHLTLDQARGLASQLHRRIKVVAVLVNPDDHDIEAAIHAAKPDLLQLHGAESHARVANIGQKFGLPVIKAVGVAEADDVASAQRYEDVADYLMFDAKGGGGHGVAFDWTILSGRTFRRPWFLAGGLTADNVAHAIQISGATMVEASTSLEEAPGVKNPSRIAAFIEAARGAPPADAGA